MDAGQKGSQQGGGLVSRCLRRPGNLKGIRGEEAGCPEMVQNVQIWSVQFSSVQDGIYVLRKAQMRSIPSVGNFPAIVFKIVSIFV